MSVELTVTIKGEGRTLRRDFLEYDTITLEVTDPIIERRVKESLEEFKGEADDIKIRALMVLQ